MQQPGVNIRGTGALTPLKRVAALMALCLTAGSFPLFATGRDSLSGWEYRWGSHRPGTADQDAGSPWQAATSLLNPPGRGENTELWLRVQLPPPDSPQPALYFDCVYYDFEAWHRDALLYRSYPRSGVKPGAFHGRPWHIVPLPAEAGGDYLYLRVLSSRQEIGVPGAVRHGSYKEHIIGIIRSDQLRATAALLLVLAGFLALIFSAGRRADRTLLWGGCALVLLGIWNMSNTRIKLLHLNEPLIWLYAEHASLYFSPVAIGLFLERIFGKGPGSVVRRGWQLLLACAAVSLAVSAVDAYWLRAWTLRPFQLLLAAYLAAVCAYITREALRGDIDARITAAGLAAAILSGLYDISVSFFGLSFTLPKISYLGLLAFVFSLAMVMERRVRVVPARLMSFSVRQDGARPGVPAASQEKRAPHASITPDIRAKLDRAIQYINEHFTENLSREGLAAMVDMNHDYFGKMFILHAGKKVSSYINELRIARAADLITTTDDNIVSIAFSVGYESLATFYRAFQGVTGLSPLVYRERFCHTSSKN